MRIINFILIFILTWGSLVYGDLPKTEKISVLQARGLKKNNCYEEFAALTCNKSCTLRLFPLTQAEITVNIVDIETKIRNKIGRFFKTKFKVLSEDGSDVKVLETRPISIEILQKRIRSSTGLFIPKKC